MNPTGTPSPAPFMPAILRRLAPKLGATVVFEPDFEVVGEISFPNGRRSFFWHNKFNFNSVSSARIAQDKGYTRFFLQTHGIRVPVGGVFLRDSFRNKLQRGSSEQDAVRFAKDLGWQVYLKPLRRSQGSGIVRASSESEFRNGVSSIFEHARMVLVEQACEGRDYRLVVLDGEVISAYERRPLSVVGDGASTIESLLSAKQRGFCDVDRDTVIDTEDPRILTCLTRSGMNLSSVPIQGHLVNLLDVANLSCGGTTHPVVNLHASVAKMASEVASTLNLRFVGVDVIMPDAEAQLQNYHVIEVNSAPGLDHYASSGPEHEAGIDALYFKLLQAIERGPTQPSLI